MDLALQIKELNNDLSSKLPPETLLAFEESINDLKKDYAGPLFTAGDILPCFSLTNSNNQLINSDTLLGEGKLIITFFRGSWCPYCDLQLKAFQDAMPQIKAKNAALIAISPQTNTFSDQLAEEHALDFEILFDKNNEYAQKLGIVITLQDFVLSQYKALGIDLKSFNGSNDHSLPIPATFIIENNGRILYTFTDVDYTKRADIQEIINKL
jgi:peroxiredoxin